ncbi:uncharacterized protein FFC1_06564 [Fusarium fujikuroi]|nr:uncharacterized protein FFC1_06564 [Fusarium fujikuroi]
MVNKQAPQTSGGWSPNADIIKESSIDL